MNVEKLKSNFVNDVKELLREQLNKKVSIEFHESIADGIARYRLTPDAFYIGGGYANFAGECLEDIYIKKYSKIGVFGDYSFGYNYYDVKYDLETFFDNLEYELAAKIIAVIK